MTNIVRVYYHPSTRGIAEWLNDIATIADRLPDCELEVIDVRARPDLANADRVIASPTVTIDCIRPPRRLVGDAITAEEIIAYLHSPTLHVKKRRES